MLSEKELDTLTERCRVAPITQNRYISTDLVVTLVETVVDYQTQTTAVERAMAHFQSRRREEIRTMEDLKSCLARFPNDREGNTQLAQYLWGYRMWTRAEQLRGLVAHFDALGISTLAGLQEWARTTTFKDFQGKIPGLGPTVHQWLITRLGIETI